MADYIGFGSNPLDIARNRPRRRPAFEISNMENTFITLDKALEFVGDNSIYQKRLITLFSVLWALFSFLIMGMPFLFESPVFLCNTSLDPDVPNYTTCDENQACKSGNVMIDLDRSPHSLSTEFQLYCERKYLVGLSGSLFFFGSSIGGFLFSQFSDLSGRKRAIMISIGLSGGAMIIGGLMNSMTLFMVCLFVAGIGLNGFETLSLVYVTEISAERFRNYSTITLLTVWAFAQIVFSFLKLWIKSWRVITTLIIGAPFVLGLWLAWKIVVETPRYLVTRKRYAEARSVLNHIAVTNKRPQFKFRLDGEMDDESNKATRIYEPMGKEEKVVQDTINHTYLDLFRFSSIRKITIFSLYLWFFRYFAYYGLNFSLASFGAELYTNFILSAIAEIIGCVLAAPVKLKMGRVKALMISATIVSASCLLIVFFPIPDSCYEKKESCYQKTMSVICAMLVKFGITIFTNVLMTYTSEVFPTVIRTLGFGLCMTVGQLGNIAMPIIVNEMQREGTNPVFWFGVLALLAIAMLKFMPETKGQSLGDYISEQQANEVPLLGAKDERLSVDDEDE